MMIVNSYLHQYNRSRRYKICFKGGLCMRNLNKAVMIFGLVAMLGLGLVLCFFTPPNEQQAYINQQKTLSQEK